MSERGSHGHGQGHGHHIIPYKVYYAVFGALIFLTITTVITASIDLSGFNVPLALAIAGVKATLVVMFFMALKYDSKVNVMIFSVGLLFVIVFLGFTLLDTEFRGAFDRSKATPISDQETELIEQQRRSDEVEGILESAAPAATDSATVEGE